MYGFCINGTEILEISNETWMFHKVFIIINNRINCFFFNLRTIDYRNKKKNYVIVAQVKLNLELYALIIRE